MTESLRRQFPAYWNQDYCPDTNLLLLYVVGHVDRNLIGNMKRLREFSVSDFDLLVCLTNYLGHMVTTPGVLAEISNLLPDKRNNPLSEWQAAVALLIQRLKEDHFDATMLAKLSVLLAYGYTDSSLFAVAKSGKVVVTRDQPLAAYLAHQNLPVIPFHHLQEAIG